MRGPLQGRLPPRGPHARSPNAGRKRPPARPLDDDALIELGRATASGGLLRRNVTALNAGLFAVVAVSLALLPGHRSFSLPALVVCHGGSIRVMLCARDPRGLEAFHTFEVPNVAVVPL